MRDQKKRLPDANQAETSGEVNMAGVLANHRTIQLLPGAWKDKRGFATNFDLATGTFNPPLDLSLAN